MSRTRMTAKGQITIPKAVRERLDLRPGDLLEVVEDGAGLRLRKCDERSPFDEFVGYLEHLRGTDPDALIDEMRGHGHAG